MKFTSCVGCFETFATNGARNLIQRSFLSVIMTSEHEIYDDAVKKQAAIEIAKGIIDQGPHMYLELQ